MKAPNIISVKEIRTWNSDAELNGKWVPARPLGLDTLANRIRLAWLVFMGKADALIWPENQ
jgi:hypothetical protein